MEHGPWNDHECRCLSYWTTGILQLAMRVQLVVVSTILEVFTNGGENKKSLKSPPSQPMVFQFSPTASVRLWWPDCFSMPRIFTWEEHDELGGMSHAKAGGPVLFEDDQLQAGMMVYEIMCIYLKYIVSLAKSLGILQTNLQCESEIHFICIEETVCPVLFEQLSITFWYQVLFPTATCDM